MTRPERCWSCLLPFGLKRTDGITVKACKKALFACCTQCVAEMKVEEKGKVQP